MNQGSQKNNSYRLGTAIAVGFLVILALIISACGGVAPQPTTAAPPIETEQVAEAAPTDVPPTPEPELVVDMDQIVDVLWVLLGFGDAAAPTVVERNTVITLVFTPDGSLNGSSGCNNYSSAYEVAPDGTLTIASPFAVPSGCWSPLGR
jgi:Na+-transporting methylmalonyl-CoA/oxaloacetate decarboxylase gamma subunit